MSSLTESVSVLTPIVAGATGWAGFWAGRRKRTAEAVSLEVATLRSVVDDLQEERKEQRDQIREQREQIDSMRDELNTLRGEVYRLHRENLRLHSELVRLGAIDTTGGA